MAKFPTTMIMCDSAKTRPKPIANAKVIRYHYVRFIVILRQHSNGILHHSCEPISIWPCLCYYNLDISYSCTAARPSTNRCKFMRIDFLVKTKSYFQMHEIFFFFFWFFNAGFEPIFFLFSFLASTLSTRHFETYEETGAHHYFV